MYQVYLLIKNLFHFKLYVYVGGKAVYMNSVLFFLFDFFERESVYTATLPTQRQEGM